ncbi:MAG: bifunctional DNA-formamidopyrimidine glycosylase/DNA-(apurinic or apyrimidinic site) lyase [gamma proteobacterium symbiont of Bathyaustriella thionipta]|nr:bifunctional DNA-formamidopyrimidine glycosylase/DNA-(apurinic or apyrimidinic site) lyase [gamma proteobacterium symbiont of Bathyaustriella thionipta]
MPELPEVETMRRGIQPHLQNQRILGFDLREHRLRWPIPESLRRQLPGCVIRKVRRRAKYLLIDTDQGSLLLHMGMSGSLRILPNRTPAMAHDHWDLQLASGQCLRFRDPRRFGATLWIDSPGNSHPLLDKLGPEPLSDEFHAGQLFEKSRGRKVAIKNFIMNSRIVVGVGNIYASESLFMAGIHPSRQAQRISKKRYAALTQAIKEVLQKAIEQGGTTLRDFQQQDGQPGYFAQQLKVYGRDGKACPVCGQAIRKQVIGQRSSYYCAACQR